MSLEVSGTNATRIAATDSEKKVHCRFVEKDKGGRATRPPLQQHTMNVGESPHSYHGLLYSQSAMAQTSPPKQGPVASQMQRSVVTIETFPLMLRHLRQTSVGDEPKKAHCNMQRALLKMRSEVSPRLSDGE